MIREEPQSSVTDGADGRRRRFQRFEITEEIARGGMGTVYRARDTELNREVALKILHGGQGASAESILRFKREARSIAALSHPGIVPLHEIGSEEGVHFFTMDFVEGRNLQDLLTSGPVDMRQALAWSAAAADALHHAHGHGVVHRDVKPGNIIISASGAAMITDFGLAKEVESDSHITQTGLTMGTPPYMSPEQARCWWDQVDARSDVYSLGATLYEMLCGRPPFTGRNGMEILLKVVDDDPPSPGSVAKGMPREVETIILKAIAKDPEQRFATAGEMAEDIRRFLSGRPVLARRPRNTLQFAWRKTRRFLIANPAFFGVFLLSLAVMAGGATLSAMSWIRSRADSGARTKIDLPVIRDDFSVKPGAGGDQTSWAAIEGTHERKVESGQGRLILIPDQRTQRCILNNDDAAFREFRETSIVLRFKAYVPSDHRGPPPEIGCFIFSGPENPLSTGYRFSLGRGFGGRRCIFKKGVLVRSTDGSAVEKGTTFFGNSRYSFEAVVDGAVVSLSVNGEKALVFEDEFPSEVSRRDGCRFGIYSFGARLVIDEVAVERKGLPRVTGPLGLGDEHYLMGNYPAAYNRYSLVSETFQEENLAWVARYRMALCRLQDPGIPGQRGDNARAEQDLERLILAGSDRDTAHAARLVLAGRNLDRNPLQCAALLAEVVSSGAPEKWINRAALLSLRASGRLWRLAGAYGSAAPSVALKALSGMMKAKAIELLELASNADHDDPCIVAEARLFQGEMRAAAGERAEAIESWKAGAGMFQKAPLAGAACAFRHAISRRVTNDDSGALTVLSELQAQARNHRTIAVCAALETAATLRKTRRFWEARDVLEAARSLRGVEDAGPDLQAFLRTELLTLGAEEALFGSPGRVAEMPSRFRALSRALSRVGLGPGTFLWSGLRGEWDVTSVFDPGSFPPSGGGHLIDAVSWLEERASKLSTGGKGPQAEGPFLVLCSILAGEDRQGIPAPGHLKAGAGGGLLACYWLGLASELAGKADLAEAAYLECVKSSERDFPVPSALMRLKVIEHQAGRDR